MLQAYLHNIQTTGIILPLYECAFLFVYIHRAYDSSK